MLQREFLFCSTKRRGRSAKQELSLCIFSIYLHYTMIHKSTFLLCPLFNCEKSKTMIKLKQNTSFMLQNIEINNNKIIF